MTWHLLWFTAISPRKCAHSLRGREAWSRVNEYKQAKVCGRAPLCKTLDWDRQMLMYAISLCSLAACHCKDRQGACMPCVGRARGWTLTPAAWLVHLICLGRSHVSEHHEPAGHMNLEWESGNM